MNYVTGTLPKDQSVQVNRFKEKLINRGYKIAETNAELVFSKAAQIESVLIEIRPLAEEEGWNTWTDLRLEEYRAGHTQAEYQEGRISRND